MPFKTENFLICIVFSSLIVNQTQFVGAAKLSYTFMGWHNWQDLNSEKFELEKGDVIACLLRGVMGTFFKVPHWLLVINERELIHVANPKYTYYVGEIQIVPRQNAIAGYNTKNCINIGKGGSDPKVTVPRAIRWNGHRVYYHGLTCSCQHWVWFWVTGEPGGGGFGSFPHLAVKESCELFNLDADHDPGDPLKYKVTYDEKKVKYWSEKRLATAEEYQENVAKKNEPAESNEGRASSKRVLTRNSARRSGTVSSFSFRW